MTMDARLTRQLIYGLLLLFVLGIFKKAGAEQVLNVAVAANFAPALELISQGFEAKTSIPVQLTISSSGRLFAQIQNRAPFDLYFSADSQRPEILQNEGFCLDPKSYATGRVVLWTKNRNLCSIREWKDVVTSPEVMKIAMANPVTAPYGTAAKQVCAQLDEWPDIEKKLVYGTNTGQAFQYAQAGVADVSFVSLSFALSGKGNSGCFWDIQESEPVKQSACVTTHSTKPKTAERFLKYATSIETASLRENLGYN